MMKNIFYILAAPLFFGSCHRNPSVTSAIKQEYSGLNGLDTAQEKQLTLRILNKMLLIRGAGDYLFVKRVEFAGDAMLVNNHDLQLEVVPAHYLVEVKKNFFKKTSDISDLSDLTRPPFYTGLDQTQLAQRAEAAIAYQTGQEVQLDWKLVFKKDEAGRYERVFPNPENDAELLTPEAYEKLLDEHLPKPK